MESGDLDVPRSLVCNEIATFPVERTVVTLVLRRCALWRDRLPARFQWGFSV